jgi:NADPH:quinone reductase-like Zn-dependent oxidoreductase
MAADSFVDLEQPRWEEAIGQVDLVYDAIGGDFLARSQGIVKPGGALVTVMEPLAEVRPDIHPQACCRLDEYVEQSTPAPLVKRSSG